MSTPGYISVVAELSLISIGVDRVSYTMLPLIRVGVDGVCVLHASFSCCLEQVLKTFSLSVCIGSTKTDLEISMLMSYSKHSSHLDTDCESSLHCTYLSPLPLYMNMCINVHMCRLQIDGILQSLYESV